MNIYLERARMFATAAHAAVGQNRKYTGEPYINHPASVVRILESIGCTSDWTFAAAWLHDTVEDTGVTLELIAEEFGREVAVIVEQLTDVSSPADGNRATRKEVDRQHTARASSVAKTIKLADLIDNTRSIVERDPEFAKVYMAEKALLLEVLKDGSPTLWKQAKSLLDDYEKNSAKGL